MNGCQHVSHLLTKWRLCCHHSDPQLLPRLRGRSRALDCRAATVTRAVVYVTKINSEQLFMGHPPRRFPARSVAAPRSTNPPKWAVWRKGNPSPRAVRAPFSHFVTSIDAQRHAPPAQPLSRTSLCRLRTRYPVKLPVVGRRTRSLSTPLPAAYTLHTHPTTYHRTTASYKPLAPLTPTRGVHASYPPHHLPPRSRVL